MGPKQTVPLGPNQLDKAIREIKRSGGALWRAYQLKESLRAVFAGDLDPTDTSVMVDRWCSKAQRSRIPEFVKTARTIRKHRESIDAAIDRGLSNSRQEGLNNKVRLIIRRAYGFHSVEATLATVMLTCRPVNLKLPYHTPPPTCRAVEPNFLAPGRTPRSVRTWSSRRIIFSMTCLKLA